MSTSVVIPYANRNGNRVENCLASLRGQTVKPLEVIIVDYGSDAKYRDLVRNMASKYGFRCIRVDKPKTFWSYPRAVNIGIKSSKGKYIMCVMIDNIFAPNFIEVFEKRHREGWGGKKGVMCVCRAHLAKVNERVNDYYALLKKATLGTFTHSIMSASREWFFKVRGFDERFIGHGQHDNDIVNRARFDGLPVIDICNPKCSWGAQTSLVHQTHGYQSHLHGKYDEIRMNAICDKRIIKNDENWGLP